MSLDAGEAELAYNSFRRFGRDRHPASLKNGDRFAYALAKETGEPLLSNGTAFLATDVAVVTRHD